MPDGTNSTSHLSEEELADLVRGIDRKHLPAHLPRKQAPRKLAQAAVGHPARESHLLSLWTLSNRDLVKEVTNLPTDNLREAAIRLLIQRGLENRKRILWALRFDDRPEVRKALEDGLENTFLEDASGLISRMANSILTNELRSVKERLAESEARRDKAEADVERLQQQVDEAQKWHDAYDEAEKEQAWLKEEINELKEQHQSDQETIAKLKRELSEEQERVQELRRSVRDLKSTLQAQAEDRDLDKALLELEEERNNSARLRLKVEGLRQDLQDAYDKRDTVRERVGSLEQEVEQLEYDKEVIIKQKRHLQARIEELQRELKELRMQRDEQMYEQVLGAMPIEEMDSEWEQAREGIRNHIHSVLSILRAEPQSQVELDRDKLWQDWVEQEMSLVEKGLVELDAYSETGRLPSTATFNEAQNLLMLRWYLLEYMRQAIEFTKMNAFPV
jgi:uncharacterized coiled-coil DUF342 family protein